MISSFASNSTTIIDLWFIAGISEEDINKICVLSNNNTKMMKPKILLQYPLDKDLLTEEHLSVIQ